MSARALLAIAISASLLTPAAAEAVYPGANGKIFFTASPAGSGAIHIYRVNPDGTGLLDLTATGDGSPSPSTVAVSPDGTKIAYGASNATPPGSSLWVANNIGTNSQQITSDTFYNHQPSFSADGSKLAFASAHDAGVTAFDIWTINTDGTGLQSLVTDPDLSNSPEFTPDGQSVVYAENPVNDFGLYKVPFPSVPIGTSPAPFADTSPADETTPSVSPDGGRVAFTSAPSGAPGSQTDVITTDLTGANPVTIANNATDYEGDPAYSPDGTKIVYWTSAGGTGALVIANADGTNPLPIPLDANVLALPRAPAWSVAAPDPVPPDPPDETPPTEEPPTATPDTVAPETTITNAPKRKLRKRRATFAFSASEAGASFECQIDDFGFAACSSPRTYKRLGKGPHKFQVQATDAAGNTDTTPAKARFKVRRRR